MKRLKFTLLSIILLLAACSAPEEIYVAVDGKANNSGTIESPLTFEAAIAKASTKLKGEGLPNKGLTIIVAEGTYHFNHPIILGEEFKATADAPITITAAEGAEVIFDGSKEISYKEFKKVSDKEELSRLATGAADKIYVATITDKDLIKNFSNKLMVNLILNDREYLPSVFPNEGYAHLNNDLITHEISAPAIPTHLGIRGRAGYEPYRVEGKERGWKGSLEDPRGAQARFTELDDIAGTWQQWEDELKRNNSRNQLTGFIEADWLLSSQPIYAANGKEKSVHLSRALAYGWLNHNYDKICRVFGMLCELDSEGEWHFDTLTNRLYIYPTAPLNENSTIALAISDGFIELSENTKFVNIVGLSVKYVGSGVIYNINGENNLVAGATISKSTATGVNIDGKNNALLSCDLVDLNSHVILKGGNRSSEGIVNGYNRVENCQIYQKNYAHEKVNIRIFGAGNSFKNNLVHNSIGQSMIVYGNNQTIEYNEFFNIGHEEGDGGSVYSGADLAGYGNIYRYNFFHHLIHSPGKIERAGLHLDDGQSGATCYGNIFYKSAGKGIFAFGGSGHNIYDNVFLEGRRGAYFVISLGDRILQYEREMRVDPNHPRKGIKEDYVGRVEATIGTEGWNNPAWKEMFPLFAEIMNDSTVNGRLWPTHYTIKNNFSYNNTITDIADPRVPAETLAKSEIEPYKDVTPDDFVDYNTLNLEFKDKTKFPDIPFNQIGLKADKYRTKTPNKNLYRTAIKEFYKDVKSMPGAKESFDSSKVVEK